MKYPSDSDRWNSTHMQQIANMQLNAYGTFKQPSEYDKRLLEVRQKQYDVRRKMWSILK